MINGYDSDLFFTNTAKSEYFLIVNFQEFLGELNPTKPKATGASRAATFYSYRVDILFVDVLDATGLGSISFRKFLVPFSEIFLGNKFILFFGNSFLDLFFGNFQYLFGNKFK